MEKFVYSLDENIDKKLLGKKGGNLKQLFSMDIPVPNSIIITQMLIVIIVKIGE